MPTSPFALKAFLAACALHASISTLRADEILKFKTIVHNTGFVSMDAGDGVEGHIVGTAKFVGITVLEDGRLLSTTYLASIDYVKGSGTYTTFETYKFDDGSILRIKNSGTGVSSGTASTFSDGKTIVVGGEGKYKGSSGDGEFTGTRLLPFGDGGDSYYSGTIRIKTP